MIDDENEDEPLPEGHALADEARDQYGLCPTRRNLRDGSLKRGVTALRTARKTTIQATLAVVGAYKAGYNTTISASRVEELLGPIFAAVYHPVAETYSALGATDSEERSIALAGICGELEDKLELTEPLDYWKPWNAVVDLEVAKEEPKAPRRPFIAARGLNMPKDSGCVVTQRGTDGERAEGLYWWYPPTQGRMVLLADLMYPDITDEQAVAISAAANSAETTPLGREADANVALHEFRVKRYGKP